MLDIGCWILGTGRLQEYHDPLSLIIQHSASNI
jgi:hypothetical protein